MAISRQSIRFLSMIALVWLLVGAVVVRGQTRDENWKRCRGNDPDRAVEACSALIQSNHETGTDLAKAHYDRALAFLRKADYGRAIKDLDFAVQINPNYGNAFYDRGSIYWRKG